MKHRWQNQYEVVPKTSEKAIPNWSEYVLIPSAGSTLEVAAVL